VLSIAPLQSSFSYSLSSFYDSVMTPAGLFKVQVLFHRIFVFREGISVIQPFLKHDLTKA